jgi:hypothetical protein
MKTLQQHNNDAQAFIEAVTRGIAAWVEAGQIAARAIEENPNFIDEVCDLCPDITPEAVKRFQAIGLRKLHPQLAISETPGARRLRKLPYSLQEKYVKEPLPLLTSGGEILSVDFRNLTPDQLAQVFDGDRVRSEAEQRAFIEDKAAKSVPTVKANNPPYRVVGGKLVVMVPTQFTRKDLAKLLAEMES